MYHAMSYNSYINLLSHKELPADEGRLMANYYMYMDFLSIDTSMLFYTAFVSHNSFEFLK